MLAGKARKRAGVVLYLVFFGILLLLLSYAGNYYRPDSEALALRESLEETGTLTWHGSYGVLAPDADKDRGEGLIFYPGGLVDESAYLPLLDRFREAGFTVVLLKLPMHLGILDIPAAGPAIENLPEVRTWYLSGHSLGGVCAGMYAGNHPGTFQDIFFLASYPAGSLDPSTGHILYGSEDHVLRTEAIDPDTMDVTILPGGNHGNFGSYGHQAGDGKAEISGDDQQEKTLAWALSILEGSKD